MTGRETILELDRLCAVYRLDRLIFEMNIARHSTENPVFLALKDPVQRGMKEHATYRNMRDPVLRIESLAVDFEFCRIRLPYGDVESRGQTLMLKAEATQYPHVRNDDLLMALLFVKANYRGFWMRKPHDGPIRSRWPHPPRLEQTRWSMPPRLAPRRGWGSSEPP